MIIALHGKEGYGKTTIANILKKQLDAEIVSFAEPVRKYAESILLNDSIPFSDREEKEIKLHRLNNHSPRELMIDFAETMKKYDPYIWVKHAALNIIKLSATKQYIIVDDLRFDVELEYLRQVFACVIFLERDEPEKKSFFSSPKSYGLRSQFDPMTDFILNTSKDINTTDYELNLLFQKRFNPLYEL